MKHTIHTAADLGQALRAVRRSAKVRLDDLAHTVGISKQTASNVEQGKPTVALGTVIELLAEMGLTLSVEVPESALPELGRIRERAQMQEKDDKRPGAETSAQLADGAPDPAEDRR